MSCVPAVLTAYEPAYVCRLSTPTVQLSALHTSGHAHLRREGGDVLGQSVHCASSDVITFTLARTEGRGFAVIRAEASQ